MKIPFWVAALILCFEVLVVFTMIPDKHIVKSIESETNLINQRLGRDTANAIILKANRWYDDAVVETGAKRVVFDFFIPQDDPTTTFGNTNLAPTYFRYMAERIETLFKTYYQLLMRVAQLYIWAPYLSIVFLPALFDGYMSWKIKRTGFDYPSPFLHHYSIVVCLLLLVGSIGLFILPIALDPIIIPIVLILLSIFTGIAIGNMQKRI